MLRKIMCGTFAAIFAAAMVFSLSSLSLAADKYIGETKAKEIALTHAKVKEADAKFTKVRLDKDDAKAEYEIEFYVGQKEYEYDIDAVTGAVTEYEVDAVSKASTKVSEKDIVSEKAAKETALAKVPGASQSDIRKFKLDKDDGKLEYDGTIIYGGKKYEFTIDAKNGKITEWKEKTL